MSTCRTICANGSPRGRRPRAISSSRSMSIRRAFCEVALSTVIASEAKAIQLFCAWCDGLLRRFAPRNDGSGNRKACRHLRRQAFLSTQASLRLYATQRLQNWLEARTALDQRPRGLRDDLGGDVADTGAGQADRTRGAGGEIEHASLHEGTTVVDRDDDALAPVGDPQLGAERQRAVGGRHGVLVEALPRGGLVPGLVAVERRDAGEAMTAARRRRHGRIGVPPARADVVAVVVLLRLGRGF